MREICLTLPPNDKNKIMKRTKNKKEQEEHEVVPEEKKSKIRLYWENRDRIGYPPGRVANMRAILK